MNEEIPTFLNGGIPVAAKARVRTGTRRNIELYVPVRVRDWIEAAAPGLLRQRDWVLLVAPPLPARIRYPWPACSVRNIARNPTRDQVVAEQVEFLINYTFAFLGIALRAAKIHYRVRRERENRVVLDQISIESSFPPYSLLVDGEVVLFTVREPDGSEHGFIDFVLRGVAEPRRL